MKKATKLLITAAAVAAVAGVSAVSFAAWSSNNTSKEITGGETAEIKVIGITSSTTLSKKIVPFDQVEGYKTATMTREYVVELVVEGDDIANKFIKVTHNATLASESYYMVKYDTTSTETEAPVKANYTNIGSNGVTYDITGSETDGKIYAHIILDSKDDNDMKKTVTFKFELVDAAVA